MTEEETIPSMMPSMAPVEEEEETNIMTPEEIAAKTQARLQKTLRIGETEEILLTRRCSIFAFMPMYVIGALILGIHLFFDWASAPEDATWYESVFYFLVDASGWLNGLGFAFVMLFFTWIGCVINHPASGRWVTLYLVIVSITPLVINFDTLLSNLPLAWGPSKNSFVGYDIATAGIVYSAIFMLLAFLYQKSFLYAVTSERIIHYQWFLYERDASGIARRHRQGSHQAYSNGSGFGYNRLL